MLVDCGYQISISIKRFCKIQINYIADQYYSQLELNASY